MGVRILVVDRTGNLRMGNLSFAGAVVAMVLAGSPAEVRSTGFDEVSGCAYRGISFQRGGLD